jgi:hypothetical protein
MENSTDNDIINNNIAMYLNDGKLATAVLLLNITVLMFRYFIIIITLHQLEIFQPLNFRFLIVQIRMLHIEKY